MSDRSISLRKAENGDLDRVVSLLAANGLPHRDVRTSPGSFFVATADAEWIGTGGVEVHGSNGLIRSVVIREPYRGRGYGSALCDELEDYARTSGVRRLYLLTTTAEAFFRRRGYDAVDRGTVPSKIRETNEFADLCPDSATCMRKTP